MKYLASSVLAHRLTLTHEAKLAGKSGAQVIAEIVQSVLIPAVDG